MTGRIVRDGLADSLLDLSGRSENATRTTSTAPRNIDGPWPPHGQSDPRGQSDNLTPTENTQLDESKQSDARTRKEHDEQLAGRHLADSPPTRRGLSARSGNSSSNLKPQARAHLSIHASPKRLELLRKDLGEV
jgi:hypothetical protein